MSCFLPYYYALRAPKEAYASAVSCQLWHIVYMPASKYGALIKKLFPCFHKRDFGEKMVVCRGVQIHTPSLYSRVCNNRTRTASIENLIRKLRFVWLTKKDNLMLLNWTDGKKQSFWYQLEYSTCKWNDSFWNGLRWKIIRYSRLHKLIEWYFLVATNAL